LAVSVDADLNLVYLYPSIESSPDAWRKKMSTPANHQRKEMPVELIPDAEMQSQLAQLGCDGSAA
jgi:hypothetical protein